MSTNIKQETEKKPPLQLKVIYCGKCGRDDMVTRLKKRHYTKGALCDGKLRVAVYNRED